MKKQIVIFLGLIFTFSSVAFAQMKTVTNADLEKFRQKRLEAEREYAENYKKLGFPSPEKLAQQRIKDEKDLIAFSQELETRRIQREAIQKEAEVQVLRAQNEFLQTLVNNSANQSNENNVQHLPYYNYGYPPYYYFNRRFYGNTNYGGFTNRYGNLFNVQFSPFGSFRQRSLVLPGFVQ